jgi:hypothetical protein
MKALTTEQIAERAEHADRVRDAHFDLEMAVDIYNDQLTAAADDLTEALDALNEAIEDAAEWLDANDIDLAADKVKIDVPRPVRMPECDLVERLDRLREGS